MIAVKVARRYQRTRNVSADIPVDAVYVGRPTRWGNPARIERRGSRGYRVRWAPSGAAVAHFPEKQAHHFAVALFRSALVNGRLDISVGDVRRELRGKDLVCWCASDRECHADVLLEVANA